MRVAVTGATGFIGGAVADHLAAVGHEVLTVGRRERPESFAHHYVQWDLAGEGPAPEELASCAAVVHAAAHVAQWGPEAVFRQVTVAGTERLLEAIDPSARLVLIGSASVYDPRLAHPRMREHEAPVAPERYLNAYARTKAAQERVVRVARPDAVVLRPRAVWGPGDRTLLPRILARVRRGWLPLLDGGRNPMSATHISSLTTAVAAAIERPQVAGPVNVADATPTSAAELLGAAFEGMGMSVRIVSVPTPLARVAAAAAEGVWRLTAHPGEPPLTRFAVAGLARAFTLDLGRLHRELGVRPDVDVALAANELRAPARMTRGDARQSEEVAMRFFRRKPADDEPVDLEARSPDTGLKYKDIALLGQLMQQGADLSKPRHALYYLYFGSRESADAGAETAREAGYTCTVRDPLPAYPDQWGLICERPDAVLDIDGVRSADDLFQGIADRAGAEFDGWEAAAN